MDSSLFQNVLEGIFSAAFLAAILRVTTPILFPSLGALISDRAGVINIGLEGTMLIAAFTGVVFSAYAQDWFGTYSSDTVTKTLLLMLVLLALIVVLAWFLRDRYMLLCILASLSLLLAGLIVLALIASVLGWLDLTLSGETIGPWLGLTMGVLMGILTALMLGFFALKLKANLILSGIAINFLGQAATVAVMYELTGSRGDTKGALDSLRMPFVQLPEFMKDVPVLSFFFDVFDNQSIMTWLAFIAMFLVWYFMYRMPTGIHLRAVGENPEAAASVGIRVTRIQYLALALSGVLSALGGIHLSMGYLTFFQNNMSSGRGFIALATPYLGGGHPIGTGLASVIFGFFDALSVRVGSLDIPSQLPALLPFIATIMALVIYALQNQLTVRVRTLRAAGGDDFDVSFWQAIQRISVLHMFMAMLAVGGVIIAISMYSAPDGFKGVENAYPDANLIALISLLLILINLPFTLQVESIGVRVYFSGLVSLGSLWLYLGLFFSLGFMTLGPGDMQLSFVTYGAAEASLTNIVVGLIWALLMAQILASLVKLRFSAWVAAWDRRQKLLQYAVLTAISAALYLVVYYLFEYGGHKSDFLDLLGPLFGLTTSMVMWLGLGGAYLLQRRYARAADQHTASAAAEPGPTAQPAGASTVQPRPAMIRGYVSVLSVWVCWLFVLVLLQGLRQTDLWLGAAPGLLSLALYGALMAFGLWHLQHMGWWMATVFNAVVFLGGVLAIPLISAHEDMTNIMFMAVINSMVTVSVFGAVLWWLWDNRKTLFQVS